MASAGTVTDLTFLYRRYYPDVVPMDRYVTLAWSAFCLQWFALGWALILGKEQT